MATEQVRILRVEGKAVGMETVASSLDKVSGAANRVATANDDIAVAESRTEAKTLSMAKALERAQRQLDMNYRAQQDAARMQQILDRGYAQGAVELERYNQLSSLNAARLNDNASASKTAASAAGLARHELVNLSRQAQDVAVSLAGGQSPLMVLMQQGSQIGDVFATSSGTVSGFYKQVMASLGGFLTLGRAAFGGVTAAVGVAGFALNDFLDTQQKVALSLAGTGRASGASMTGINSVASSGSSILGLSTSEARKLAAELAATGKVANDNILPIVKMGKDIATAFGEDAAAAASRLAEAFSNPVKGAESLNQRLGFLDAAMQRNITNLVAQNRIWEAQRVLAAGAANSLADVNNAVGTSTKFWTALGNIISNAWDKIGEGAARVTGIGLKIGLEEQVDDAKRRIEELEQIASRRSEAVNKSLGTLDLLAKERTKLEELTAALSRYGQVAIEAQQRQFSFAQTASVRNQQPEIEQTEKLRNEQALLVKTMVDVQTTGGPASEILKRMGVSYEELGKSLAIANANMVSFKNEFQTNLDSLKIANAAITAFSPDSKGEIARWQSIESTLQSKMTPEEKATLAQQAYNNAVKQSITALSEAARVRQLTADQSVASAQQEVDLVGKSIGQQNEMRANLQARQQLEQEASQYRTLVNGKLSAQDEAQLDRLKKINAEMAKQKQLAAERQLGSDIGFERSQIGLTDSDQQINSRLRSIYGDDTLSAQAQFYRKQLQINESFRTFMDTSKDTLKGFASDFRSAIASGASAWDAFKTAGVNALNKIADKLMSIAIDNLWANAFGGSSGGGILGLFGLGGGNAPVMSGTGLGAGTGGLSFPMFASGTSYAPGGPAMINEGGRGEIVNLPSGAQVIPHDISMQMAAASANDNRGPQAVHVSVGVTVDEAGNLKAYVKDVAHSTTADGIRGFVDSPAFVQRVGSASSKARARRLS